MPTVTMPLPRMNTPAIPATVTFNFREMPALDGPGIGEVPADDEIETGSGEWSLWQNLDGTFISPSRRPSGANRRTRPTPQAAFHKHPSRSMTDPSGCPWSSLKRTNSRICDTLADEAS